MTQKYINEIAYKIVGCAIEVHKYHGAAVCLFAVHDRHLTNLVRKDTLNISALGNPGDSGLLRVAFRVDHDLEYSLSCSALHFLNWRQGSDVNLVSLFHLLKYRAQCTNDRCVKLATPSSMNWDSGI